MPPRGVSVACTNESKCAWLCIILCSSHNDLPWQYRKRTRNHVYSVDLDKDLREQDSWVQAVGSTDTHTDIPRLREGMVGAQVCASQSKL